MKNHALKSIVLTMLFFLFLSVNAFGQFISPSLPDNMLTSIGGAVQLNCAMLNYSYGGSSASLLRAVVWSDPGTGMVNLNVSNGTTSAATTISNAIAPDVIIGNFGSYTSQFNVAVVYISGTSLSGGVYVTIYPVSISGGTISLGGGTTYPISTFTGSATGWVPHIDVIAEAGNTTVNALPYCDKFIVSYQDPVTNDIHGYYSSLNSPGTYTDQVIVSGLTGSETGDVAAIQHLGTSGTPDDYGLFVYSTGPAGSRSTFYKEWDATTGTVSIPTTIDLTSDLVNPRIDGVDDYNNNTNPLMMNWEIVATAAGIGQIAEYNNLSGSLNFITSATAPYNPNGSDGAGVVAAPVATSVGSNDHFAISYESEDLSNISPFAQYVDRTTGTPSSYYKVNLSPANLMPQTCIGATCNTSKDIMICWENNATNAIMYKITDYSMSFKPGREQKGAISMKEVSLSPNPATNDLIVTGAYENGGNYTVTDITGKQMLKGTITSDKQHIDISRLAKGDYILDLHYGNNTREEKFVKE